MRAQLGLRKGGGGAPREQAAGGGARPWWRRSRGLGGGGGVGEHRWEVGIPFPGSVGAEGGRRWGLHGDVVLGGGNGGGGRRSWARARRSGSRRGRGVERGC